MAESSSHPHASFMIELRPSTVSYEQMFALVYRVSTGVCTCSPYNDALRSPSSPSTHIPTIYQTSVCNDLL